MAINLDRFYTHGDPSFYNRAVARDAVEDFFRQGLVRGAWDSSQKAYFSQGRVWAGRENSTTYPNQYWLIRANPERLNTETNPLYRAPWVPRSLTEKGSIYTIQPNLSAGTIDRLNPANRRGLQIKTKEGLVAYDRITPFRERPMSTHLANLKGEARIAYNTAPFLTTGAGLTVAGGIGTALSHAMASSGRLSRAEEMGQRALEVYESLDKKEKEKRKDLVEIIEKGYMAREEREQNLRKLHPQHLAQPIILFDDNGRY